MKKLIYQFVSSRSFTRLFSILAVLVLFAGTASAYLTTNPPSSSTGFTLSGPFTICQFFRPDLKEVVQVNVDSSAFQNFDPNTPGPSGPYPVILSGTAVCGIPDADGVLRNFAFFSVNNVTFGCVTRTVSGNTATYAELFSDLDVKTTKCPDEFTDPVSGYFQGLELPAPVGNIQTMLTYCGDGVNVTSCVLNVGIEVGVNASFFDKKVCPKDASTGRTVNGQIFAFRETIVNGEYRPGTIGACYCDGDLDNGAVTCGQGSTGEPIKTNTAGANFCEFNWEKTGNESGDTINLSGSPSQVNAAIYDSPVCPVRDIDTKTVSVCNGVTPRQFKLTTDQGRFALTFQIAEGNCAASLQDLVPGETRLIYAIGAFTDGTRLEGWDDVTVVTGH